ncbi:uncharacterized protein [Apostichopus japonicus]
MQVDINQDIPGVHPSSICDTCRRKLSRCKTASRKSKKNEQCTSNVQLHKFSEHSEDNCAICTTNHLDKKILLDFCRETGFLSWMSKDGKVIAVVMHDLGEVVLKRIIIGDNSVTAFILGKVVNLSHSSPFKAITEILDSEICVGNHDFDTLAEAYREEGLKGTVGQTVAQVETLRTGDQLEGKLTIRHNKCHLIISNEDVQQSNRAISKCCAVCKFYRANLHQKLIIHQQRGQKKKTKTILLSKPELINKVSHLQTEIQLSRNRQERLKSTIRDLVEKESVTIDSEELLKVIKCNEKELESILPANTHCALLWEQQKKALQSKSSKGMRWHPAIIKWAIALHSKSSSAYDILRDSGFLILPHPSTLHMYTHFTPPSSGLNVGLLQRFFDSLKLSSLEPHQKLVNLIFDEMKIKAGLVFSKTNGKLVGFIDVGDVSKDMERFEARCTESKSEIPNVASHVLLFMVRGLTSSIKFPVAFFFTNSAPGHQLYEMAMNCIKALKLLGLTVLCLTSDGASCNRKLYEILSGSSSSPLTPHYKTKNVYEENQYIYFNSDAPHLLKTLRNNFENSNWNRKTRNLVYNGKPIQWIHLLQLQEWDKGRKRQTPGLVLLPKLSYEHLHLNPGLQMKVSLAAQVMSKTVANALQLKDSLVYSSTIKFILMVNKFLDCLNVGSTSLWLKKKNTDIKPYTSVDDERLVWLTEEFLGFLKEWTEEGEHLPGLTPKQKQALHLSVPTLAGCHIAVHSFTEITKLLLAMDGVNFFLSDKLNQDPVEEFFSKQRSAGGHHDNPSAEQFGHHLMKNIAAGSHAAASRRANVRREQPSKDISDEPLPKKKR